MYTLLQGGIVYDPIHGINGECRDLYICNGHIARCPVRGAHISKTLNVRGKVLMAGGIDIHTHIGGGKVNIARMMLPDIHHRAGPEDFAPSTLATGYRYAEMGYTACFEPAMLPSNARQTHMELADTPMVDKGAYAVLGNDDFLLRLLSNKRESALISDYVGWIINATKALGIKVVNPGGISAFKFNQRRLDLDEKNPHYGVTPRQILKALTRAVTELGIPHPLHIHGCNLGVPGNARTTLDTIRALDGIRAHLTHLQFHSYGNEGDRGFSSAAAQIAEAVNACPTLSIDVGQIMFQQTITISGDSMHQHIGSRHAHPRKWSLMDIECDAGCGIVPFRYRDRNFVNALQWAIGLELFLLISDPWRVFLTTDHPNGGPFLSYPHLIRLLMDRSFRNDMLATIHPDAARASTLASIDREYSLYEIAIMTRAAPARSLGLRRHGHLGSGAVADIAIYSEHADKERMFSTPDYVFKNGELIVRNGKVVRPFSGNTHVLRPEYDRGIHRQLHRYFNDYQTLRMNHFQLDDDEIRAYGDGDLLVQPCN